MCPAGSPEAVRAAVRAGADAVYFGAGDFNARRNAKNFSDEELAEALKYCRLRGVHTYLTVNTLVTDRELPAAKELILRLNELGADAVIVQDLGMVAGGDFTLAGEGLLKISYLKNDADVKKGDVIITNGAGGKYPKDLILGTVEDFKMEDYGISSYATIRPAADLEHLSSVLVVKAFEIVE